MTIAINIWFLFLLLVAPAAPQRPAPRKAAPKPPSLPQAEALYDYQASDTDEISLIKGQKLFILKEGIKYSLLQMNIYWNAIMSLLLYVSKRLQTYPSEFKFNSRWLGMVDW